MKFDIIVGNPPYGMRTDYIHLMIMNTALKFCTDKLVFIMPSKPITKQLSSEWYNMFKNAVCNRVEVMDKGVFKGTNMDNTSIFYCDRNDKPENYCKKLDVDKAIYNAIDSDCHRMFIDKVGKMESMKIDMFIHDGLEKSLKKTINDIEKTNGYYLNVNRAGGFGAKWLSGTLKKVDILDKKSEITFCKEHPVRMNIFLCPNKEYGENLKRLMVDGRVLRYGLWLTQINQDIITPQFKYVPDLDYTNIHTDEELLSVCGFTPEEIEKMMYYLKHFDFSKNRNDVVRKNINNNKKILI